MTWLFGALAISSLFMVYGWAKALLQNGRPVSIWNGRFCITFGLLALSLGMAWWSGLRTFDLLAGAVDIGGAHPRQIAAALGLLLFSKALLVWTASVGSQRRIRSAWPAYLCALAMWTVWLGVSTS
ncbi:MAG: hypothetical protein ABW169_11035 [Sphingobium sp.]